MRFSLVERLSVIAGVFALMIGIGISSVGIVSAARGLSGHSCSSKNACASYTNTKSGPGIQGKSTGTGGIGVSGLSTSGAGVYGESQSVNSSGVYGDATSSGTGVYGISNAGYGVWGTSSSSDGVYGTSYYGDGVYGSSTLALGVYGYSKSATGAYFENDSNGAPTLRAVADSNTPPLEVSSVASGGSFEVDSTGDGIFSGEVEATAFIEDQEERGGSRVGAFSSESTSATIEDTGTARLEGGEGAVRFDSAFARTIDATRGYQVFLTPSGETRGWLYVAAKYEGGFIVREAEHGRSSVYFDYRVVAHPYGASDARLPQLNLKSPPIPRIPRHVQAPQPAQP